ncbi:DUF3153 domain-containing protein [Gloeocapsa sp. PCC 73106]|uniref:DUF3153 domain-containing protein n=1 Tax=Gloeocapsa sp. PCC 73106 TaxID=102232 RepID=UPI0002AD18CE|nr:DUF3153 domain-containing protein [Gloeocapsa sp. PCC 73106]ELR96954.1 Protein of unknown function (DUF3153) [Gloeocapsa sp. PCC 73106]
MRQKAGLVLAFVLLFFLNGCVDYDIGINFDSQHRGTIVQKIGLTQQLTSLSQSDADQLLESINTKVKQLKGKTKKISSREIVVTIPFSNGRELVNKFNLFFTPQLEDSGLDAVDLLQLNPDIYLTENNFLLLQRERLKLIVDLTSLGVFSQEGNLIVTSGSLVNLDLSLKTPFAAKNISNDTNLEPEIGEQRQLIWRLKPGQVNEIEVIFWLPSTLGIGTVIIVLMSLIGFFVKYKRLPWVGASAT